MATAFWPMRAEVAALDQDAGAWATPSAPRGQGPPGCPQMLDFGEGVARLFKFGEVDDAGIAAAAVQDPSPFAGCCNLPTACVPTQPRCSIFRHRSDDSARAEALHCIELVLRLT